MNPTLQKQLNVAYPMLFKHKDASAAESCMHWGICIGDGWYDLLDAVCDHLTFIAEQEHVEITFAQIKEKFGQLTIYIDFDLDKRWWRKRKVWLLRAASWLLSKVGARKKAYLLGIKAAHSYLCKQFDERWEIYDPRTVYARARAVTGLAARVSTGICEICGKPARLRDGGWLKALCDECRDIREKKRAEDEARWAEERKKREQKTKEN